MFVGIDVAKAELVIATRPAAERWTVENEERAFARWLSACVATARH